MASTTTNIPGVLQNLALYKYNPAAIQRTILQHLKDVTNGSVDIVDPTNPFVFCLESSAVNTAAFMVESEANTRKQYPVLAQTIEDLYLHMSDKDFVDRFSTPATTTFAIMIQKDDLITKMVYDPVTLGKKITIPGNTEFKVSDTTFSLQYPIDIKQLVHGGIQIVYDTTNTSPLQTLTSNVIDFEVRTDANRLEWIYFEFDVQQFKINSINASLSSATGFNQSITIKDEFYYGRVYYKNSYTNSWVEIRTTHTDQVYDAYTPTAVFKLVDKTLQVYIPQIYITSGLIQGNIRVDVYETKGVINMAMGNYKIDAFVTTWLNIDSSLDTPYTAVMPTLSAFAYSAMSVNGGTPPLTFEELRTRVITNAIGDRNLPITNLQIQSTLEKKGYNVIKDVDVVTNRIFLATRALPTPINDKLITAAASSIETLVMSMAEAVTYPGVIDNGNRVTLTPELVYTNDSGIIKVFTKQKLQDLLATTPDNIATTVTEGNFLYTPFHYVLDTNSNEFELRPYYLDKPIAKSVRFIAQNDTTGLQINTKSFAISKSTSGYTLTIVTKSNDAAKALEDSLVKVQLSYIPVNENMRAYLNGTLVGRNSDKERIFSFDLSSNFDLDTNDNLALEKFFMFTPEQRISLTPLSNEFDILYSTSAVVPSNWQSSGIDNLIGTFALPLHSVGVTQEKIKLIFGYALKTLWARSRSVVEASLYQTYTHDVPWLYEEDVFLRDPVTGSSFSINTAGDIVYTKLHSKGDPVLDQAGNPTYRFRIGDVMLDQAGNPIASDIAKVSRQIDMMFIEGSYYFATDSAAAAYRGTMVDEVVNWLVDDLANMGNNLLEQTRLYFYPKTAMGSIAVLGSNGLITTVEAGQYFVVNLYVSNSVYQNTDLRETLRKTTVAVIDSALQKPTVSISDITTKLGSAYGNDVISLTVSGLGGAKNLSTLSVINNSDRCNIRKRLVKLPDDKLIVEEDITIAFIKHDVGI